MNECKWCEQDKHERCDGLAAVTGEECACAVHGHPDHPTPPLGQGVDLLGQTVAGGKVVAATIPGHEYVLIEYPNGQRIMAAVDSEIVRSGLL